MNKADKDKVIAALESAGAAKLADGTYLDKDCSITMAITIMRGLAEDAEPVARLAVLPHGQVDIGWMGMYKPKHNDLLYTSPQARPTESHELDLSMMARRLIGAIRRIAEDDSTELKLANDSLKWLQSKALVGSPLRDTSPQAAQTAVKSESSAQAAQAPARLPSEGKPIEALAPTEAQEREAWLRVCREIIDRWVAPDMYKYAVAMLDLAIQADQAGRAWRKG